MKTLIAALLLCALSHPASAAATYVSHKNAAVSASGVNLNLTGVTIAGGSGHVIWVTIGYSGDCGTQSFVLNDPGSNSYTLLEKKANTLYSCTAHFYAKNVTAFSSGTIQAVMQVPGEAWSGVNMAYVEVAGADSTTPLEANSSGAATSTPVTATALTPATGSIVLMSTHNYYTGGTYTANNSFTIPTSGTTTDSAIAYREIASGGSVTPSFGVTGSVHCTIVAVSFKAGAGGSSSPRKRVVVIP